MESDTGLATYLTTQGDNNIQHYYAGDRINKVQNSKKKKVIKRKQNGI